MMRLGFGWIETAVQNQCGIYRYIPVVMFIFPPSVVRFRFHPLYLSTNPFDRV
jgi:hypothetical protein